MKLCLRITASDPTPAQELKFDSSNRYMVRSKIEKFPDVDYVYETTVDDNSNNFDSMQSICGDRLIVCASTLAQAVYCKEHNIRFYFKHYITSYYELNAVIDLGAEYALVGPPIFFEMHQLQRFRKKIKIRIIPNVAYNDGYFRENGVVGSWIRPEDLYLYNKYVDACELFSATPESEKLLYDIYFIRKEWLGELKTIIRNFDYRGYSNIFETEYTKRRLNCGQRCQKNNFCHSCYYALALADPPSYLTEDSPYLVQ